MSNKAVKTSLVLSVEHRSCWQIINNRVEIGLCVGNKERFTYSRVFKFLAGALYSSTIADDNIETIKEDIKSIVDNFKKQETPNYIVNRITTNNEGENLREKRLIQLYGGGLCGRYRLALESVNTKKLLDLLSPTLKAQFRNETSIEFLENDRFRINYKMARKTAWL